MKILVIDVGGTHIKILATGETEQKTEELLALAKEATDDALRRATYERLADLDLHGRGDSANV